MTRTAIATPDPEDRDSLIERLARLPAEERERILATLDEATLHVLNSSWRFTARPDQLPPSTNFLIWLLLGGRGAGKSRSVSEWVHDRVEEHYTAEDHLPTRTMHRIGAGARTGPDGREILVEGESGIMAVAERRGHEAKYEPSKRRISWPELNARLTLFSAEEPDSARGPQYHTVVGDEYASWDFSITDDMGNNLWTNLLMGLRLGANPQAALSTTPKRIPELRELVKRALDERDPAVVMSTGSTMANAANLSPVFLDTVISQYEGTRLYKQEVLGLLLDDDEDALWTEESITRAHRFLANMGVIPTVTCKVVGVDPSTSLMGDETGIVGVGLLEHPLPGVSAKCAAVLADRSLRGSPERWGREVVALCRELGTTRVVAERNQGGEMVRSVIANADDSGTIEVDLVWSSNDKYMRAEPVSQLYEQSRVVHLDRFRQLESQMTDWSSGSTESPDRMDAMVNGMHDLMPALAQRPSSLSSPVDLRLHRGRAALEQALEMQNRPESSHPLYHRRAATRR